jgi:hypothetical protein
MREPATRSHLRSAQRCGLSIAPPQEGYEVILLYIAASQPVRERFEERMAGTLPHVSDEFQAGI